MKLERQEREERDAEESQAGLSWSSREQWEEMRNRIGTTLNRYATGGGRDGAVHRPTSSRRSRYNQPCCVSSGG